MNPLSFSLLESTFPGWPEFTPPTPLFMLMLTLGLPALLALVVTAIGLGLGRRDQVERNQQVAGLVDAPVQHEAIESRGHDVDAARPVRGAHAAPRHAELD